MAKLNKKVVDNVLNDFKDSLFISSSLKKNGINHYDFFEYLKQNDEANKEYQLIEEYNNMIKDDQLYEQTFNSGKRDKLLVEVHKANNKKKYTNKIEIENQTTLKDISDTDLDEKIKELYEKMGIKS